MTDEVKSFYDKFRDDRMIGYRIDGSRRIDEAFAFARGHLQPGWKVADVGCGIGIFAEKIGQQYPTSRIIGIDVSEKNIDYAKQTVSLGNVHFATASVTEQFEVLKDLAGGAVDAFCLIDVIEHIPEQERGAVFASMAGIASPQAVLLLAYPSPEYQQYLIDENPEELQVIDNIVRAVCLLSEATAAGWQLMEFRYVDLWMKNQYIHASFQRNLSLEPVEKSVPSLFERLRFQFDRRFLRPGRLKKFKNI
jgi:2-polyprenyl-3-methyl-5-hydroxy-6-metoxy-1,4-benzoquinol methylase